MIVIGVLGLCIGAALAQNFRVLVLVPSCAVATGLVVVLGLAKGYYWVDTLVLSVEIACALQFGYLIGLSVKRLFVKDPRTVGTGNAWLN